MTKTHVQVWVLAVIMAAANAAICAEEGFAPLFPNDSLEGWKVSDWSNVATPQKVEGTPWRMENGVLYGLNKRTWIASPREYGDFVLKVETMVARGSNGGIGLRFPPTGDPAYTAMEIQVVDSDVYYGGGSAPQQRTGSIYDEIAPTNAVVNPQGEWNAWEITCCGSRVTIVLNGRKVTDVDLSKETTARQQKGPALAERPLKGHIGFQNLNGSITLRNIRIKTLDGLRAGVARVDITPDKPVMLSGYASRKELSQGVHDPLSARVVAFEAGGKRLVLVSTDLIGFYGGTAEHFRQAILAAFKLDPSELFLSAIHTHSAPTLVVDTDKGHENNLAYTRALQPKLIEAVGKALASAGPASVAVGVGYSPVGSNRREVQADGSIVLGRNPYGPADKQVLVAKVAGPDGAPVAVLFDYATHATAMGPRNYMVGGDVLGLAEQFVERILGGGVIAPAFAGASGNIDPWFRVLPAFESENGWFAEAVLLGTLLGEEVVHVYRRIGEASDGGGVSTACVTMSLPAKSGDAFSDGPAKDGTTPLTITAAKVGEVAFIGFGCEMITEIGMAIKEASPWKHTFVITHCNGAAGYLPTKEMYDEGGYEVRSSHFAPEAAEMVKAQAVKMLSEL